MSRLNVKRTNQSNTRAISGAASKKRLGNMTFCQSTAMLASVDTQEIHTPRDDDSDCNIEEEDEVAPLTALSQVFSP